MNGKTGFVTILLFVLLLSTVSFAAVPLTPETTETQVTPVTPETPHVAMPTSDCAGDCGSAQTDCICGTGEITYTPGYCGPDNNIYSSQSECESAVASAPPSPPSASLTWLEVALIAMSISMMLLAITYMIGYGLSVDTLKAMAKDELFQLIALALMIAVFFGANSIIDMISTAPELTGEQANMQTTALLSINGTIANLSQAFSYVADADKKIGFAASQASTCQLWNVGYSVSGCGGFSMLSSPFSLAGSILGFAIGEMNGLYRLIELALAYALPLLLPFGIILRTFRLTRGAGGFLIALAISMHILLPMGVLFVDMLGNSFLSFPEAFENGYYDTPQPLSVGLSDAEMAEGLGIGLLNDQISMCRPGDTGDRNSDRAIDVYESLRKDMKSYLFFALIKGTFGPLVAVLMMVSGLRFLTSLAGAEVDVTALGRLV